MKQRAREIWAERVKRWMASGLDAERFAEDEGCNVNTLKSWRWQLGLGRGKKRSGGALVPTAQFVELIAPTVTQATASAGLPFEVTLPSGARLVVPARFDRSSLEALLRAIDGAR